MIKSTKYDSMKSLTIILLIATLFHTSLGSQSCFSSGITFTSQTQIDNFSQSFPSCTEIDGDVIIEGDTPYSIQSLLALQQLTSINGNFKIINNDELVDLDGIQNLSFLGGDLLIYANNDLEDITSLSSIQEVGGFLHIHTNYTLTDLTGLHNISSVGESLLIFDNDNLEDISALGQISTIGGSLTIAKNDSLTTLVGLENIYYGMSDLRIFANPILSICSLPRICTYLSNGGNHMITGNAEGCSNSEEISLYCLLASPCSKAVVSVDFNPVISGSYQAIEAINSNGHIPVDADVNFKAANCIVFEGGFSVAKNAIFSAEIDNCGL